MPRWGGDPLPYTGSTFTCFCLNHCHPKSSSLVMLWNGSQHFYLTTLPLPIPSRIRFYDRNKRANNHFIAHPLPIVSHFVFLRVTETQLSVPCCLCVSSVWLASCHYADWSTSQATWLRLVRDAAWKDALRGNIYTTKWDMCSAWHACHVVATMGRFRKVVGSAWCHAKQSEVTKTNMWEWNIL